MKIKYNILIISLICFCLILSGCNLWSFSNSQLLTHSAGQTDTLSEAQLARQSLERFLAALADKDYDQAVNYYGGSYHQLKALSPEIKTDWPAKLWEKFCLQKKGLCLEYNLLKQEQIDAKHFKFTVQYFDNNGSIYKTPGCSCSGGGQKDFEFTVRRLDNQFFVTSLPPLINN